MPRKKDNDVLDAVFRIATVLLILYWFTDKKNFWILVILLLMVIYVIAKLQKDKFKKFNEGNDLLSRLKQMTPTKFEFYVADLYNKLGYKTEQVGGSYDGGIDVIATKNGIKHYIQCKKFITRQVGVGDLRNFYGAMADKLTNAKGIFITTNIFTTEAVNFAENKPIELVDGQKLLEIIRLTKKEFDIDTDKSDENKICPLCGSNLVQRKSKYGNFIGCSAYPKCTYKENV